MEMSKEEFNCRVTENSAEFKRQGGIFDLTKFHYADGKAGDFDPYSLGEKFHDAYAAITIGALAFIIPKNGADGIALIDGELVECEFKNCAVTVNSSNAFVGPQGGIYCSSAESLQKDAVLIDGILHVSNNKACGITSLFKATFKISSEKHKQTKNRPTFLLVMDANNKNAIIDCYLLDGETVLDCLNGNSIALASFINYGDVHQVSCGEMTGFHAWCYELAKILPKGKKITASKWEECYA